LLFVEHEVDALASQVEGVELASVEIAVGKLDLAVSVLKEAAALEEAFDFELIGA
jgi:hypothetical protein